MGGGLFYFIGYQSVPALVILQGIEVVCGDCLQLVTAVQEELGTNTAFTWALVGHAKRVCETLTPDLAQQVRASREPHKGLGWKGP